MEDMFALDVSGIPKELRLIIELLKHEDASALITDNPDSFTGIDWDEFIDLAMHHRVYPVLYMKMKTLGETRIPAFVMEHLAKQYKINTFQMLKLTGEMGRLSKLFSENNIRHLYLKGPVIAKLLYRDISLRTSKDLDVLVPVNQLEMVDELLLNEGFEKGASHIPITFMVRRWRDHHISYVHPKKNIQIEIHWKLHPGPTKEPSFDELWSQKRKSDLTRIPVYYLSKEDLFVYLIAHGARHGWFRLRWLLDIHQLMKPEMDWKELYLSVEKSHYQHVTGQGLTLTSQLFGTKLNSELKARFDGDSSQQLAQRALFYLERKVNLHHNPSNAVLDYHRRYIHSLNTKKYIFIAELMKFYPSSTDKAMLPLPKVLHFLYFPLRPFLAVWRKIRKQAQPKGING